MPIMSKETMVPPLLVLKGGTLSSVGIAGTRLELKKSRLNSTVGPNILRLNQDSSNMANLLLNVFIQILRSTSAVMNRCSF